MRSPLGAYNLILKENIGSKDLYERRYRRPECDLGAVDLIDALLLDRRTAADVMLGDG